MHHDHPASLRTEGFTYLVVLIAIAMISVGLLATSEVWITRAEREQQRQMDWIGAQYVQAIQSYYLASPGSIKQYPSSIQELLEDKRHLNLIRHLRSSYIDRNSSRTEFSIQLSISTEEGFACVTVSGTPHRKRSKQYCASIHQ